MFHPAECIAHVKLYLWLYVQYKLYAQQYTTADSCSTCCSVCFCSRVSETQLIHLLRQN